MYTNTHMHVCIRIEKHYIFKKLSTRFTGTKRLITFPKRNLLISFWRDTSLYSQSWVREKNGGPTIQDAEFHFIPLFYLHLGATFCLEYSLSRIKPVS